VVVPAYRAAETVCGVIAGIGLEVERIYLVDDACPEGSGDRVQTAFPGPRVVVLRNGRNLGVGGAVKRGYAQALADGMDAVVKLDGDGQMDPAALSRLVAPVLAGEADYAKGNRFGRGRGRLGRPPEDGSRPMPTARRIGNNIASFAHKWITGYWNIVDPANGYTAIGRAALGRLDLEALADCYFFETDMLFQLGLLDAVVVDVPVPPRYGSEKSHLRIRNVVAKYPLLALRRGAQRVWIKYFVQDFNVASLEVAAGVPLFGFGLVAGGYGWAQAVATGRAATAGTVMFAALPIILGFQLLLSAISYDIARTPTVPLARLDRD
jgi:dolichol-phosphate mannosyltransferase